jgi:hypothetical protein
MGEGRTEDVDRGEYPSSEMSAFVWSACSILVRWRVTGANGDVPGLPYPAWVLPLGVARFTINETLSYSSLSSIFAG